MQRQVRMIGMASSDAKIEIIWDGVRAFSGSTNQHKGLGCIASWVTDTSLWGNIPIEIRVQRGQITWVDIHMNYTGIRLPLPGSEASGGIKIKARDFYAPPSHLPDGKLNVIIDGNPVIIERTEETKWQWHHEVLTGQYLQAQYRVDRRCLVLFDPLF